MKLSSDDCIVLLMASIAGLYSFGGRSRDESHSHDRDHTDRGQGFCARAGFFKKARLTCSVTAASQQSGWFNVFRGEHSGETHITGITGIVGHQNYLMEMIC